MVVLKDGSTVAVRPIRPDDESALADFYTRLSPESQSYRFFAAPADVREIAKRMVIAGYESQFGLVATSATEVVGHAVYIVTGGRRAEMGLAIADGFQGRGLGLWLCAQLADAAAHAGIEVFEAVVKADNTRMLELLRESGFPLRLRSEPGEVHAELATAPSDEAGIHFERRNAPSAQAAVQRFLAPRSIALIGSAFDPDTTDGTLMRHLLEGGFAGRLLLVNGTGAHVQGLTAFTSVRDIPGDVDLAVITLPAAQVVAAAEECAAKGVHALVVISPGFAESGGEGIVHQQQLLEICRRTGMRMVQGVGRVMSSLAVKGFLFASGVWVATTSRSGILTRRSTIMIVTSGVVEDVLFQQAVMILTATLAVLFGTAQLLSDQPLPAG